MSLSKYKILITCPPMIQRIQSKENKKEFSDLMNGFGFDWHCPTFTQTMTEQELITIIGQYDGWIIGDDPATYDVFLNGIKDNGKLKAVVKWGVGTDNVDIEGCKKLKLPFTNTPNAFGNEVADVAIGYLLALSRELMQINSKVHKGIWYKPSGISLTNKKVALIGFGNIGQEVARRLLAFKLNVFVVDPHFDKIKQSIESTSTLHTVTNAKLNDALKDADFIITTCALNKHTHHIINKQTIMLAKNGVRIINVSRGPVVKESDVCKLLESGYIKGFASDVFEIEPLPLSSPLMKFDNVICGTHNGSNTVEAVDRTNIRALKYMKEFLNSVS